VDALERVVAENRAGRAREAAEAEALIEEELGRSAAAARSLDVVPLIRLLRAHFHDVARAEATRAAGRLSGLTDRDRDQVVELAAAIANKLLHRPLTLLKKEAERGDARALEELVRMLFDLRDESIESIESIEPGESGGVENVVPLKK